MIRIQRGPRMKGMYLSLISLIIMSLPRFRVAAFTRIHQGRSLFHCSWPKSSLNLPLLVHESATALVVSGLPRYYTRSSRLHLAAESESQSDTFPSTLERTNLLQRQLSQLDIDASALHEAAIQSIQNPTEGYNNSYGKSAIRCYRSFIYPKSDEFTPDPIQQLAFASRCARQVDFLIKRHKSAQSDLIRHVDTSTERTVYPIILVLDNVRSALNVGSLFRTADATGCTMVVTVGITPHPLGSGADKLAKSALGAEHCVPSKHFELVTDVLKYLRDTYPDYTLVGMETTHFSLDYTQMEYPRRGIVLFLGNEVTGVDTEILPLLNQVVEIPMHGLKNSLNIAACAPVVLYEILRQWDATRRR